MPGTGAETAPSGAPSMWLTMLLMSAQSLALVAPCGLPLAIAVYAVLLSLPVWIAGWWLGRRA